MKIFYTNTFCTNDISPGQHMYVIVKKIWVNALKKRFRKFEDLVSKMCDVTKSRPFILVVLNTTKGNRNETIYSAMYIK